MNYVLKNDNFEATLNPKGAEIISMISLNTDINYMWRRDSEWWANSAPILFPIVGAINNNECRIDGETYSMTQHGFARHQSFDVLEYDDQHIVFSLKQNEEIQKQYPYLFELKVTYTLNEKSLSCLCEVVNLDHKEIHFQIGGHPAFACPFHEGESSNDYYLEFEENETLDQKVIDVQRKGMSRETIPFLKNEKRFFVRQSMFEHDAIVVQDFKSKYVTLKSLNHNKSIRFTMNNFDHLGIWTGPKVGGLLAIEPWVGHIDYVDFNGEFKDKQSCVALKEKTSFKCEFIIEINE